MQGPAPGPPRACLSLILLAECPAGLCGAGQLPQPAGEGGSACPSRGPAPPALRALIPALIPPLKPLPALSMVLLRTFRSCLRESWNKTHLVIKKKKKVVSALQFSWNLYPEHRAGSAVIQSPASMPAGICGHHHSRKSCPVAHPRKNPPCWALAAQPALGRALLAHSLLPPELLGPGTTSASLKFFEDPVRPDQAVLSFPPGSLFSAPRNSLGVRNSEKGTHEHRW